ncbi:MAG: SDR family NAD(P)-dependent oxidoreductase [Nitriliruptoraceae bacterium]
MELSERKALVTGAGGGFGRAIARGMAARGADVALADLGDTPEQRDRLEQHAEEVRGHGRRAVAIAADVRRTEDCERMAEEAIAALGHVDILVANAGVCSFGKPWELTEDQWDSVMSVNLRGVWLTTKFVVPHMIERRAGSIVMTSSRNGLSVEHNLAHYNASKAGVISYMKSLALEAGPYGIRVNAVCPTQMADRERTLGSPQMHTYWDQVAGKEGATYEEFDRASGAENLLDTSGQPEFADVAEGVLWLASDRASLVTGTALPMDAGYLVKRGG